MCLWRLFHDLLLEGVQVLELELRWLNGGFRGCTDPIFFEGKLKVLAIEGKRRQLFCLKLSEVYVGFVSLVIL